MAESDAEIIVKLMADSARLQKDLDKANKKIKGFEKKAGSAAQSIQKAFQKLGTGISGALGALALGAFTRSVVQATQKQEMAIAQLRQGYESTAGVVGQSVDEMIEKAGKLQNVTIFGDEQFIEAQSQLITFTNVVGQQFDKTIELAADLSVRMGQDLKSSVLQLGKALNDPVANLGALSRSGIQFSKDQKEVIKQLAETGKLAEAQKIILAELERQFGGSARAARDTFGGALQSVQNAFGDLLESKSGLNAAKTALEDFTTFLQDPRTVAAADKLTTNLIEGFTKVADAIRTAIDLAQFLGEEAARTFSGVASDDIAGLEAEAARIKELMKTSLTSMDRFRFFGPGGVVEFYDDKELKAELAKVEAAIDQYYENNKGKTLIPAGGTIATTTPTDPTQEINQRYKQMLENIRKQREEEKGRAEDAKMMAEIEALRRESLSEEVRAVEELQEKYTKLSEAIQAGKLSPEEGAEIAKGLAEQFDEQQNKAKENGSELSDIAKNAAASMQGAFADFLFDPFSEGLDGMAKQFGQIIQRMIAEAAAAQIMNALTSGLGSMGGPVGSFFSGAFGGARASGGPVNSGSAYLVGERGPELFVPKAAGTIVPNNEMNTQNYNISINAQMTGNESAAQIKRSASQMARQLKSELAKV